MSKNFEIKHEIPKYKGWDNTAFDFKESIGNAIEQYSSVLITAKEISDENEELKKLLEYLTRTVIVTGNARAEAHEIRSNLGLVAL